MLCVELTLQHHTHGPLSPPSRPACVFPLPCMSLCSIFGEKGERKFLKSTWFSVKGAFLGESQLVLIAFGLQKQEVDIFCRKYSIF